MKLIIRDSNPQDADGKGYVHWKSWQETYSGLIPAEELQKRTLEKCQDNARCRPGSTMVAELNGEIVGFVCYCPCRDDDLPDHGEVQAIYILKEAQGLGIGRRLMDVALAKLSGFSSIALWVLKGNDHAIGFYEHYGYHLDGKSAEISVGTELRMILSPNPFHN